MRKMQCYCATPTAQDRGNNNNNNNTKRKNFFHFPILGFLAGKEKTGGSPFHEDQKQKKKKKRKL